MTYSFHPDARDELYAAAREYESLQENLGLEFVEEIYRGIERIRQFPHAWQKLTLDTRKCLIRRFPFGIVYEIRDNHILIYAIMHHRQKPGYWHDRTGDKDSE